MRLTVRYRRSLGFIRIRLGGTWGPWCDRWSR